MGLPSSFPTPQQVADWKIYPKYLPSRTEEAANIWLRASCRLRPRGWANGGNCGARGRGGTSDSSTLTVLVLVEHGRPVRVAAPHVSPQPAPHPPPPAFRGAGSHPGLGAAALPPPQPGPAGGASAGLAVTPWHESDPSAPGSERCWRSRTLARLSSRRGRGGRELGEEGGRRRRSCWWWLLVSGKSWIYLDPSGSSLCLLRDLRRRARSLCCCLGSTA